MASQKVIMVYKFERAKIFERLRADSSAPVANLNKEMETIGKLVEKRATDIVELVKSIPGGEDLAKSKQDGSYESSGVSYENSRVSSTTTPSRNETES